MSNCINIDFCHLQTSRTKTHKRLKNKPETLPSEGLSCEFDIHCISRLVCLLLLLLLLLWDFLNRATKHRLNEYVYKSISFALNCICGDSALAVLFVHHNEGHDNFDEEYSGY